MLRRTMDKKVIVIIGATSGIGRATALQCARQGHHLVLACRQEKELSDLAARCQRGGTQVVPVVTDISREDDVTGLAQQAIKAFGYFDVWINDAAVGVYGWFEQVPSRHAQRVMDVNIMGCVHGTKAALRHFKSRKSGILINVSSVAGVLGQPFSAYYAMSKFAIRGLCLSLQAELSHEKSIKVCCVIPGAMDTPFFQHAANFTGRQLKALPPVFNPNRVARAVLKLLKKPRPEVFVGINPLKLTVLRTFFPHFFAKNYQRYILKNQFQNKAAALTDGNIFNPIQEWSAQVYGGWRHN
jgi:short-subunit dehydrogenase